MTGINYYIKFFADGVASQWLGGYGIHWYRTCYRGFGIWYNRKELSGIEYGNGKVFLLPQIYIGVWWIFHFSLLRIPARRDWNL
jgi:hypothetical protein